MTTRLSPHYYSEPISKTKKLTIIVTPTPFNPRAGKIAYALEQEGWEIVLLYSERRANDYSSYCKATIKYKNVQHLLELCHKYNAPVYHCFCLYQMDVPESLIKSNIGNIVIDLYDQMAGMINDDFLDKNYPGQLEKEKYCLENADGLCCRNIESQVAKRNLGYKFKGKRLFFLDHCWDSYLNVPDRKKLTKDELHLVFCGNMSLEKYNPDSPYSFNLWLAKSLAEQKVHYHIFPGPWLCKDVDFDEKFSDYLELQRSTEFFHLHKPMPNRELIVKMSEYDIGILILGKQIDNVEDFGKQYKSHYAIGNKLFDFIDAGLPIVLYNSKFSRFIFSRYGVCFPASSNLLTKNANSLRNCLTPQIKKNIEKTRSVYSLKRNLKRLINFYDSL